MEFFGSGEELRDWVEVNDLVTLLLDLAASPSDFDSVINAGTGIGTSVRAVLQALFLAAGSTQSPVFAGTTRVGDPERLVADATQQRALSTYFRTSIAEGLRRYIDWYGMVSGQ
jgi:UDP-glucose 4-epimerase